VTKLVVDWVDQLSSVRRETGKRLKDKGKNRIQEPGVRRQE